MGMKLRVMLLAAFLYVGQTESEREKEITGPTD